MRITSAIEYPKDLHMEGVVSSSTRSEETGMPYLTCKTVSAARLLTPDRLIVYLPLSHSLFQVTYIVFGVIYHVLSLN